MLPLAWGKGDKGPYRPSLKARVQPGSKDEMAPGEVACVVSLLRMARQRSPSVGIFHPFLTSTEAAGPFRQTMIPTRSQRAPRISSMLARNGSWEGKMDVWTTRAGLLPLCVLKCDSLRWKNQSSHLVRLWRSPVVESQTVSNSLRPHGL